MKIKSFFTALIIPAALLAMCSGCVYWHKTLAKQDLNDLQRVRNYWGRIAVSGPHWIADTNQFKVNFNEDPTNYAAFARANVAGGQASSLETSLLAGQTLQGTFTPPISTGSAALTGSSNTAPFPQIPTNAEAPLASTSFSPLFSLLNQAPVPDERQVVNKAINDKIAEQLLELISSPTIVSNQEQVMFGVMQVTCQPGQQTSKGFVADLSIALSYGKTNTNNGICWDTNAHPNILAVLPLINSENVELQQSDRGQVELAQALSAAFAAKGANAAASALADYIKRQQSDIGTRNLLPIVTTYASGPTFGFQIYPSLQAIVHPGNNDSKAGDILQPITFPAVVAIRIDATDVQAQNPNSQPPWSLLVADIRTRWIDQKRPFWYSILGHNVLYKNSFPSEASLYEDMYEAKHLDYAKKHLDWLRTNQPNEFPNQFIALETAFYTFKGASVFTLTSENFHPENLFKKADTTDTNAPIISDVFPHLVWRNRETKFAILGTNLDGCSNVTIAGIPAVPKAFVTDSAYYVTNITLADDVMIAGIVQTAETNVTLTSVTFLTNHLGTNETLAGIYRTNVLLVAGANGANVTIEGILGTNVTLLTNLLGTNITRAHIHDAEVTLDGIRGTNVTIVGFLSTNLPLPEILCQNLTLAGDLCKNPSFVGILGTNGSIVTNIVTNKSSVIYATLPFPNQFSSMTNASNSIDFVVSGPKGKATKTLALPLQGEVTSDATITVSRDTNSIWNKIDIKNGQDLEGKQLLEALKEILEKSESPPKSTIIVP